MARINPTLPKVAQSGSGSRSLTGPSDSAASLLTRAWIALILSLTLLLCPKSFANQPNRIRDAEDGAYSQSSPLLSTGVAIWHVSEPYINLWIHDQPLTYTGSSGQSIGFQVAYKQRNTRSTANIFGLGPLWECSWLSYVEYSGTGESVTAGTHYLALGGTRDYVADGVTHDFKTASVMSKILDSGTFLGFEITYPTGATETYGYLSSNLAFLSKITDPVGRASTLSYSIVNGSVHLTSFTDPDGKTTSFTYDTTFPDQIRQATVVPYDLTATFSYDGNGKLLNIVNTGVLTNTFAYDVQGLITNLTTVYGTTSFGATTNQTGEYLGGENVVNRSLLITEPDGNKQLFMYRDLSSKISGTGDDLLPLSYTGSELPITSSPNPPGLGNSFDTGSRQTRNSFHWNAKQFDGLGAVFKSSLAFWQMTLADYKIARRRQWLRGFNNDDVVTDTLSMEQGSSPDGTDWGPLLWHDYAGKISNFYGTRGASAFPRFFAYRYPNAQTRYVYTERNQWQNPTRIIDTYTSGSSVAARTNTFNYAANGIDLIEWRGPSNELVSSYAYNSSHQIVTHFNVVNDRTDYTYDSGHRLTGIKWPTGLVTTNLFLASGTNTGWLEKTIDYDFATGQPFRTNQFTAYAKGLPTATIDARSLTVTSAWDDLQRLTAVTVPAGTYTYEYDKLDLKRIVDPLQSTNRFDYDPTRHMKAVTDAASTNSFNYICGLLCHVTNALQKVVKYDYDNNANFIRITYPDWSTVNQKFDIFGRLTNRIDAQNNISKFFYNHQGLPSAASNAVGQVFLRKYDIHNRLTNEVDANGVSVNMTYDTLGRLLTRGYPDGGVEKFQYSAQGLIAYTNQLDHGTRFGYDAIGRRIAVTNANLEVLQYTYSPGGEVRTFTDGKNQTVSFGYDAYGRLTSKTNAVGDEILRFQYDAAGRLASRWTPAKLTTTYAYDNVGNLSKITYTSSPGITNYYDATKRLTNMQDGFSFSVGSSVGTGWTYTSSGELKTEDGPLPNDTITYDFYFNHIRSALKVQQESGTNWVQQYGYDGGLRMNVIQSPAGWFTNFFSPGVLSGTTAASSLIQKRTLANGAYVTNAYDNVARLAFTKLMNGTNSLINSHAYTYNAGNQRTRHTRTEGSYVDFTYENLGQLQSAIGKESGGASRLNEQFGYGYDTAWNLSSRTNNALVQSLSSDNRNHLNSIGRSGTLTVAGNTSSAVTNVTVNGTAAARYADNTYAKDGFSVTNGVNSYTVIAQDSTGRADTNALVANLPATVNFAYDQNGNLTSDGLRGFDYDDENQLVRVTVTNAWKTEFVYDGLRRRRSRLESTWLNGAWALSTVVDYIYDGNVVVSERWGGDEPAVNYTRGLDASGSMQGAGGIGGLLARSQDVSIVPKHNYYHADGNGNITAMLNASQQIVAQYLYDPFGKTLATSGWMADANVYRFSSQEFHENSGLYAYALRFYEPRLGRWLNGDPLREGGGINLYTAFGGDPVNKIDPHGTFALVAIPLLVAGAKAVATWEGIGLGLGATALLAQTLLDHGELINPNSPKLVQFQPGQLSISLPKPAPTRSSIELPRGVILDEGQYVGPDGKIWDRRGPIRDQLNPLNPLNLLSSAEHATLDRLKKLGYNLIVNPTKGQADFIDPDTRKTYDAVGGDPNLIPFWDVQRLQFLTQIDLHVSKYDFTAVDLTGFPEHIREVVIDYILNLPQSDFDKIIPIGF
ncbi:MAG: hypothetical protein O2960_26415 [Verrucomicrobia bacterium]|nr:hypothetical protein [Verrucomicrobiota bacterium]